jgi:hypothetical protein
MVLFQCASSVPELSAYAMPSCVSTHGLNDSMYPTCLLSIAQKGAHRHRSFLSLFKNFLVSPARSHLALLVKSIKFGFVEAVSVAKSRPELDRRDLILWAVVACRLHLNLQRNVPIAPFSASRLDGDCHASFHKGPVGFSVYPGSLRCCSRTGCGRRRRRYWRHWWHCGIQRRWTRWNGDSDAERKRYYRFNVRDITVEHNGNVVRRFAAENEYRGYREDGHLPQPAE